MHDDDEHPGHFHAGPNVVVEDIEGLEMFTLRSVGIDIGSSTSHLVFSRLTLRREGAGLSARFRVTEREVLYRSPILLTPYRSGTLIDTDKVKEFIHRSYGEAGFIPEEIDTGAVVITGEALNKENSKPILETFARESGKFICASAGPNHEALLAAYGCGAVELSRREGTRVLNVDMGGGTTKLALIDHGAVVGTAALSIGARLIAFDGSNTVRRIEPPARFLMKEVGRAVEVGQVLSEELKGDLAAWMARCLIQVIEAKPLSDSQLRFFLTGPLPDYGGLERVDRLVFSGGVSEHIYGRDEMSYGDLGPQLARETQQRLAEAGYTGLIREPVEGIRATVIGAGEYTVQASGNTSYISSLEPLPAYGLQVLRTVVEKDRPVEEAVRRAMAKFDLTTFTAGLALALSLGDVPDYPFIRRVAEGIAAVVGEGDSCAPLFLVLEMDVAKSLGGVVKEELELEQEVVAVDGIEVGDLDFIDIGAPMGVTEVIPVTVRSFMFPASRLG